MYTKFLEQVPCGWHFIQVVLEFRKKGWVGL